jgi:hypothetical protein
MTTTTSYGTWCNAVDTLSVEHTVIESLGSFGSDYDVDGLISAYRSAINAALPASVSLCGDEFIGPYYEADQHFDGYPLTVDGSLDIKAIVDGVDFWSLVEKYDTTA